MTGSPLTAAALLLAVIATVAIGVYGVRFSRTTSDFLVASRTVGPQWNAAAISGEYLSAASFLGVAGLIAKYGADALWYPVGFTAGYLGLLLFVAAPLRRSGAYTVPDFAEFRLGSARLRKVAMLVVVVVCVYYLVPQYQGAGLALKALLGLPVWVGPLVVGVIVISNVVAGGMRSITFVQAFQYWLKLTAIAIPALALLGLFVADRGDLGGPLPPTVTADTTVTIETDVVVRVAEPAGITVTGVLDGTPVDAQPIPAPGDHTLDAGTTLILAAGASTPVVAGTPSSGAEWISSGGGLGGGHPLYQVLSIIVATFLGTMGLPHVLVRFYTNPDGRAARRTALAVIALLSLFYLFPTLLGVFSRLYVPRVLITGNADAAVLLAPGTAIGGPAGQLLAALVAAGAIAAFLATSSGLLVSIAGALATDVLRRPGPRLPGGRGGGRADPDPAVAGHHRRAGVVTQCRTGVRRRRVDAVPAARARHLVARADRVGRRLWTGGRRRAVGHRGDGGGGRRDRRRRSRRLARGDDRLPRRGHRSAGVRDDDPGQPR